MSFLQPMLLAALPLALLPIVIHLINQRRYQTLEWAAMMFLLAANRMSRGYARIRQWLILALRTLAVASFIFAVARPLASGVLGLAAGGRADTTLILLDRSPSMQQRTGRVAPKLDAARAQLAATLETLGSSRWVLIDSASVEPQEISSPAALIESPHATGVAASADMPAMLQAAHDYIKENNPGRTEVWILSDLRENDWNAESGRWSSLRDAFLEFPQEVRFHLLADEAPAGENLSVRVTDVRREDVGDSAELVVSLAVQGEAANGADDVTAARKIPLRFEIDGARSETTIELVGGQFELKDHRIALDDAQQRGWGRVSLPTDGNPADDQFYFVFDEPAPRRTVIVADDPRDVRALKLAAEISADRSQESVAEVVEIGQLATVAWEQTALLVWQAPLPSSSDADLVADFVDRGGHVAFFPPRSPTSDAMFGVQWNTWIDSDEPLAVETWRGDQDLWAHTASGAALPVGKLKVSRHCGLKGEFTTLATLAGGEPLLARVTTDNGGVYFCTTTVKTGESSLAADGVALYVAVQRAVEAGVSVLGNARLVDAGHLDDALAWRQLAGDEDALSTEYQFERGAYADGQRMWAVNRPAAEDDAAIVDSDRVAGLFEGLDFHRVASGNNGEGGLVQEIWRMFLIAMLVAMVGEAALCLPRVVTDRAKLQAAMEPAG